MRDRPPAFPEAFRAAIDDRGISLDRLGARLRAMGTPVSTATLSYWRSGRTRPERVGSLAALSNVERIVGVPPGSLAALLDPPKPRGRAARLRRTDPFPYPEPVERLLRDLDTSRDIGLTRLSGHDHVHVGPDRGVTVRTATQLLRAEADDIDRFVVIHTLDLPCAPLPEVCALRNCRLGRVRVDVEAGLIATELLFPRPLARHETILIEHGLRLAVPERGNYYEKRCRTPVHDYLIEIHFDPSALPDRVIQYRTRDGVETERIAPLDAEHSAHGVVLDYGPGRFGLRWEWPNA